MDPVNEPSKQAHNIVRRHPRAEPWDIAWATRLDHVLDRAAAQLQTALGFSEPLGILPAVYFPRLRAGFVIYGQWGTNAGEVARAFPWNPSFVPPPFTSFAPPVALDEKVFLLTDVARVIDEVGQPGFTEADLPRIPARNHAVRFARNADLEARVGVSSWTLKDGVESIIDAHLLAASGVEATTCLYLLPALGAVPTYVPLLYFQANHAYDVALVEQGILELINQSAPSLSAALVLASEIARLRSDTWINPKSGLLNQAGFIAVKDDLQRRVANGEWYAEMFFDIDEFKKMNDRCGYAGADWIAAELADRVLLFLQHHAGAEYAAHRAAVSSASKPNGFRALLAHVSGDEFKLFAQTTLTRARHMHASRGESGAAIDKARLSAIAEGIIAAARASSLALPGEGAAPWEERHRRAFDQTRAGSQYTGPASVIATKTTVSLGVSLLDPRSEEAALVQEGYRPYPIREEALQPFRTALEELDTLAERAIEGAKRRGRNRVMFSDAVLRDGGVILSKASTSEAVISLGQIDGVQAGAVCRIMYTPHGKRLLHRLWRTIWKRPACIARATVITIRERDATIRLSLWWPASLLTSCYLEWENPQSAITLGVLPAEIHS